MKSDCIHKKDITKKIKFFLKELEWWERTSGEQILQYQPSSSCHYKDASCIPMSNRKKKRAYFSSKRL